MNRKIIISNKEFTMPKMSIDTYTEYLDIAEQTDAHPRYTRQDIEVSPYLTNLTVKTVMRMRRKNRRKINGKSAGKLLTVL